MNFFRKNKLQELLDILPDDVIQHYVDLDDGTPDGEYKALEFIKKYIKICKLDS